MPSAPAHGQAYRLSHKKEGNGGAVYILGAVVYALRRPDPAPGMFGYHEVFHALVIAAALLHFVAIANALPPRA
jgi:hemolysin III